MKKTTRLLIAGIILAIIAMLLAFTNLIGAEGAYFLLLVAIIMIAGPVVLYIFNKE